MEHGISPTITVTRMMASHGNPIQGESSGRATLDAHDGFEKPSWASRAPETIAPIRSVRRREAFIAERRTAREPIEGYGRPHDGLDPRAHLLLSIAKEQGVYGDHCLLAESIEAELEAAAGRRIGINIDGVSAALLSDLDPRQARPILIAPRTLSLAAHFIEQQDQGNKWRHIPGSQVTYSICSTAGNCMDSSTFGVTRTSRSQCRGERGERAERQRRRTMTLEINNVNASPDIEAGSERLHLQRLADLHAIQQLAAIYPILVDSQDLDGLVGLFAEDAIFLRAGAVHSGRDELHQFYGQIMNTYSLTVHTVHQHVVDLALGANTAVGVQMGHGEVAVDGQRMLAAYRYDDEYCRVDGRWLFARRQMRYQYFTSHEELGLSMAGRQRVRVPGAAPREAEIPEELPSYRAAQAARDEEVR